MNQRHSSPHPAPTEPTVSNPQGPDHPAAPESRNPLRESADYATLLQQDTPLLDVRAPVEFAKGAIPNAINLPLMNDEERHLVGQCYQQKGQQAAIDLGLSLVSGTIKQRRIDAWVKFVQAHPQGYLYCFRGGLRSRIAQQWLEGAGYPYPRITGGYKALRHVLLERLTHSAAQLSLTVLGGFTGTGKTEVLLQLAQGLDLEGYARHRGSSFGKQLLEQPAQIDF